MKRILSLILITLFFGCQSENKENQHPKNDVESLPQVLEQKVEVKYVTATSGLNYRTKPKGEIIGKFEFAEEVQIIKHSSIFEKIDDNVETKKGEWLGVKLNNDTVYTFGAYLSNDKTIRQTIQGQENGRLIEVLLPFTYRTRENENPVDHLNKNWFELNEKDGKYHLQEASYTLTSSEDACTGDVAITINSKNKTLLFINNLNLKLGEVYTTTIEKDKIWPDEKISFNYKNSKYTIRAEGDILSSEEVHGDTGLERFCVVENYKLYISTNDTNESLFLEEKSFDDTFVELLFVGDIDSDGKLDFVFEANRHYEEKRVILYLSSEANENEIIKKAAEISIVFAC